ncbi:hypothetical protein SHKM778_32680 [Streptomyces sp. KM77-8]|uniref:Uncharacterized protein n=1 Tax=Streptomyces haneummycinicus TaxID=3074435 RepID=A0AAT9HHB9_9ACTN
MGGVVHGDAADPDLFVGEFGEEFVQRGVLPAHDGGGGAVDGRQLQLSLPALQAGGELLRGDRHGHHASLAREAFPDQAAAQGHHAGAVLQGERAGDGGRGDLALGVSDDGGGFDSVGAPQRGKRDHDGPQHRLDDVHHVQVGPAGLATQDADEVPVRERRQGGGALRHPGREHRRLVEQFDGHPVPLGALTGEDEDGSGLASRGRSAHQGGTGAALGELAELFKQCVAVGAENDGPVPEPGPGGGERQADVGGTFTGPVGQVVPQFRGLRPQRVRALPRDNPRDHLSAHPGHPFNFFLVGCSLQLPEPT